MIPQISKALSSGFTSKQIIDVLLRKFPDHADKIKTALASGYTAEQVLKYLGGGRKELAKEEIPQTEHEKTMGTDTKRRETVNKAAIGAATLAATPLLSQAAGAALSRALPQSVQSLVPGFQRATAPLMTGQSTPPSPQPQEPFQEALQKTTEPQQPPLKNVNDVTSVTQPAQSIQPKGFDTNIIKNSIAYKRQIDALINSGNGPEEIEAYLQKFNPQFIKTISKEGKGDFKDVVAQYMQEKMRDDAMQPEGSLPKEQKKPEEIKSIAKSETVATPHGVGEVKEIRNGQAIVDVDGKLHKVKEEELEAEPEEAREAKFDFDISSVPEDLRSGPLNEVYLPYDKRHVTVKYNAGLKPVHYIYFRKDGQPISNDYINKIVQSIQLPTTSGANFWGAWSSEKADSRGSANYHELVKNSQEEGEKDDHSKEYWFIKQEAIYEHPYMEKMGKEELRRKEKEFNEAKRKPRKKKGS